MKLKTIEEKVQWYSLLHKQNLNGRETEDELYEAGILVGIEETEDLRDDYAIEFAEWVIDYSFNGMYSNDLKDLLEEFKEEKGL